MSGSGLREMRPTHLRRLGTSIERLRRLRWRGLWLLGRLGLRTWLTALASAGAEP